MCHLEDDVVQSARLLADLVGLWELLRGWGPTRIDLQNMGEQEFLRICASAASGMACQAVNRSSASDRGSRGPSVMANAGVCVA